MFALMVKNTAYVYRCADETNEPCNARFGFPTIGLSLDDHHSETEKRYYVTNTGYVGFEEIRKRKNTLLPVFKLQPGSDSMLWHPCIADA